MHHLMKALQPSRLLEVVCQPRFPSLKTTRTARASYNLTKGESINVVLAGRGKTLVSANERFELGFFNPDGKRNCWFLGIWYYNLRPLTPVWVANPKDPISNRNGGQFNFLPNGPIALRDGRGEKTFFMAGNTSLEDSQTTLTLMDSGNLVLRTVSGTPIWQSFENPSDTFLPGMKMNGKLKLTAWVPNCEGNTNGNESSSITLEMNNGENDNTLLIRNKSNTIWKSPESFYGSDKLFDQVYELLFNSGGKYEYNSTRIVMSSTGQIQLWDMRMNSITPVWSAPENECSKFGFCGKYASCNSQNTQSPCRCLPGFKLDDPDSSQDCSRLYSQQLCEKDGGGINDKFAKLKVKKVVKPDTPYDQAKDEAACEKECRSNCKCNAYAYETAPRSPTDEDEVQGIGCLIWSNDITDMEEDSSSSGSGKVIHVRFRAPNYRQCQSQTCGYNLIPYPLRAGANCGDPNYSDFSCNNSTDQLNFTIRNLSLPVTSIDGEDRSFDLQITNNATCINMVDNLQLPDGKKYQVPDRCDSSSSLKIIWVPPPEPICNSGDEDCVVWPNSTCKNHYGEKRCICNPSYKWNGTTLSCTQDVGGPSSTKPSKLKMIVLITVVTAGSGILLLALFAFLGYRRTIDRRRRRRESENRIERLYNAEKRVKDLMDTGEFNEEDKKGIDVPFFDLKTILEATNYFSDENKLGEGGFGPVYKGIFPGGQEIAVKRLSSKSLQGLEEFKNEVVLIAKLQHRNLVRLLGYCVKGDEKILLYEYMKNRSLDAFIFDHTLGLTMEWKIRFEIIMGIARGLLYLHQDSRLRIIHRDLKTSNILLDDEMNPKISDFGLARIVGGSETEANTMRVVGTYGYMSPEYALEGLFSIKSDVFSFGVIVLEIISGRRNTGFYDSQRSLNLLGHAWNLWLEENVYGLMDQAMPVESCNRGEVLRCVNVGLLCVQEDPGDRPTMSNVVFTLGNETAILPIPKQPAFVVKKWLQNNESSSSSKPEINSSSTLTCTMEEGR